LKHHNANAINFLRKEITMSIDTSYEDRDIDSLSGFECSHRHTTTWLGRDVCQEIPQSGSVALATAIQDTHAQMQNLQGKIRPMGEGSWQVAAEKNADGTTKASANIEYETDSGVKVGGNVTVDSNGNTSGSVSAGGKFWDVKKTRVDHAFVAAYRNDSGGRFYRVAVSTETAFSTHSYYLFA
jgi:hypothetical protein